MTKMGKPIIDDKFLLKKIPGKGGWTYTDLPPLPSEYKIPFGWIKVKGTIDGFEITKYNLMPYGGGKVFLPVKAGIRKKIKKEAGDHVHVILFPDNEPTEVPKETLECLEDEPGALRFFNSLNENEKLNYIKWIYSAKTDQARVDRLAKTVDRLMRHKKFHDK